jgi:hypothetical protein
MPDAPSPLSPRTILALIFGGLLLWGLYIATGVVWYGLNPLGALVVLVCVAIFLGFWAILLRLQKGKKQP